MNLDPSVDLGIIARTCESSSGAELKALATEAGMFAIREERTVVYHSDLEMAAAKILPKAKVSEPEELVKQYI
jgi:proteasome regulatory subunit